MEDTPATTVSLAKERVCEHTTAESSTQADGHVAVEGFSQTETRKEIAVQADPSERAAELAAATAGTGLGAESASFAEFIRRATAVVLEELEASAGSHAFDDHEAVWEDPRGTSELLFSFAAGAAVSADMGCSAAGWNCAGTACGAAFSSGPARDHAGWCAHASAVAVWNVLNLSASAEARRPAAVLETPCCVTSLAFHPRRPTVVAAGLFNGEVRVWDYTRMEDPLLAVSPVDDCFHREPVSQIEWVQLSGSRGATAGAGHHGSSDCGSQFALATTACDGRVLLWTLDDALALPTSGYCLVPTALYHGRGRGPNHHPVLGATAMGFSADPRSFVVGTEAGGVLRCLAAAVGTEVDSGAPVRDGEFCWARAALALMAAADAGSRSTIRRLVEKHARLHGVDVIRPEHVFAARPPATGLFPNPCNFAFEPHAGPVTAVATSPHHRHLFLTCSTDGSLALFHMHRRQPLLRLEPSSAPLLCVAWSTARPVVFATGDAAGRVHVFDLSRGAAADAALVLESGHARGGVTASAPAAAVTALAFDSRDTSLLLVADFAGYAAVHQLPTSLCQGGPADSRLLARLGAISNADVEDDNAESDAS